MSGRFSRIREEERKNGSVPNSVFVTEFKTTNARALQDTIELYEVYKEAYGN